MKKLLKVTLSLSLLLGGVLPIANVPTQVEAASTTKYTVAKYNNVPVYAQAKTSSKQLGKIVKNTKLTVLAAGKTFTKIKYGTNYGYVKTSQTTKVNAPNKVGIEKSTAVWTKNNNVVIYSQAKATSKQLEKVAVNTQLAAFAIGKTFTKVKYQDGYGYVKTNQITKTRPILFQDMQLDASRSKALYNEMAANVLDDPSDPFIRLGYEKKFIEIVEKNIKANTFVSNLMNDFKAFRIQFTNENGKKYDEPIVQRGLWEPYFHVNFVNLGKNPSTKTAAKKMGELDTLFSGFLYLKVYKHKPSGNYYVYHVGIRPNSSVMAWELTAMRNMGLVE